MNTTKSPSTIIYFPYSDHLKTVRCLDTHTLGNQRFFCRGIIQALSEEGHPYRYHPTVDMWEHSEGFLIKHAMHLCAEYEARGHFCSLYPWFVNMSYDDNYSSPISCAPPLWIDDPMLLSRHRRLLLEMKPEWYTTFDWPEVTCYNPSRV